MKNKHKGLKVFGALAGIAAIGCIVPACVVSCGSSNSSSSSSSSSSTSTTPTLPTSLSGSSLKEVADNWDTAYSNYASSSNYNSWMESNLQNYVSNAPTYFNHLATSYDSLTGINTNITSESISGMPASLTSTVPTSSSSSSSSPLISKKNTNLSGYLPLSYTLNYSTDGMPMAQATTYWLKLNQDTLSNLTVNDSKFSFTLTSQYTVYEETTQNSTTELISLGAQDIVQTVKDATFASTLLAPLTSTLNSNSKTTKMAAGWYMNACSSNSFTFKYLSDIGQQASEVGTIASELGSMQLDATSASSSAAINGATTFNNPTSTNQINAPLVSEFYNNLANYVANTVNESLSSVKDATTTIKDFQSNLWLNSFAMQGIAGYALNNKSQISSDNAVDNVNTSLLSNLNKQVNLQINLNTSSSTSPTSEPLPTPTPTPTSTPSPTNTSSLPSSLSGSTYSDVNSAWSQAYAAEQKASNYSTWMESNVQAYAKDAVSNFEMLASEYDAMTKQATSLTSSASLVATTPTGTSTPSSSSYSTTGYLPFESNIAEYVAGSSSPASNVTQNFWLKLTNESVSNWTANSNGTFSFVITSDYDAYVVMDGLVKQTTWTITQTVTDATFASTLLTSSMANSLAPTPVKLVAGWYMSKCSSDVFSMPNPTAEGSALYANLTSENKVSINGATSYNNPTSASFFSSPLITNFYNAFTNYMVNEVIASTNQYKEEGATVSNNQSTFKENLWFSTFIQSGIAGYALNSGSQITSSSNIQNKVSEATMSSLSTPIDFEVKATLNI